MDEQTLNEWLVALRSGEYQQGHWCLLDEGKYCCLGVLGDILTKMYPDQYQWIRTPNTQMVLKIVASIGLYNSLPIKVLDRFYQYKLIEMNDLQCKSFGEIADYIESTYCGNNNTGQVQPDGT